MVTPEARRDVVKHLRERWQFSERKACRIARISHTVIRYQKRADHNGALRKRLRELAQQYPRFGAPKLYMQLRSKRPLCGDLAGGPGNCLIRSSLERGAAHGKTTADESKRKGMVQTGSRAGTEWADAG